MKLRLRVKKRVHSTTSVKLAKVAAGSGKTAGIIRYYVQARRLKTDARSFSPQQVIEIVNAGLPFQELEALRSGLGLSMNALAPKIGLSRATLNRRRIEGRLAVGESDRVIRFARLFGQAIALFGSEDAARAWLTRPQVGLGGAVPVDYAETEVGAREVERLLGRIEYGVYS